MRSGAGDGRLGSVSSYNVRHCVCPVVAVRFPDEKEVVNEGGAIVKVARGRMASGSASSPSVQSTFASAKRKSKNIGWDYGVCPDSNNS
nr:hypothetical protein [Tanacetum cinerariifolium]